METTAPPHHQRTLRYDRPHIAAGDEPSSALALGTRLDKYEVIGLIAEGGFGIVYHAYDAALDRDVAIKEYLPASLAARSPGSKHVAIAPQNAETFREGLESFVAEARLLAKFDHPSLVKVYSFWEEHGTAYMVMPLYVGQTLKEKVQQSRDILGEKWLRSLLGSLLDAIEVLHRSSCVHRDIAPDNIIIVDGVRPVLLDLGAARYVVRDRTQALTVILKPGFAPIEQYAGERALKQGPWTDLYALAAVMYWVITGTVPPPSVTRLMSDKLVPLQQAAQGRYSPTFLQALDQALALKPQDRPQSVAAVRALLSQTPTAARSSPPRPWRRRAVLAAACVGAAIALLLLVLQFSNRLF